MSETITPLVLHEDAFYAFFVPYRHPKSRHNIWGGIGLETFGEDFELVRSLDENNLWTVVDSGCDADQWIISGVHYVNRVCYLVTEKAHNGLNVDFRAPHNLRSLTPLGLKRQIHKLERAMAKIMMSSTSTGTHRMNEHNAKTGLTLTVRGFNPAKRLIEDVGSAVELLTDSGHCAAAWSFGDLMIGWNKKHAQAAYVPYESEKIAAPAYRYFSPALLGEGTDLTHYLAGLCEGQVIFDPGSNVKKASTAKPKVKARSQFRMSVKHLEGLYKKFGPVEF